MSIFKTTRPSSSRRGKASGGKLLDPDQGEMSHLIAMMMILFFMLGLIGLVFLMPEIS
jgi:hypothetical protein